MSTVVLIPDFNRESNYFPGVARASLTRLRLAEIHSKYKSEPRPVNSMWITGTITCKAKSFSPYAVSHQRIPSVDQKTRTDLQTA